jgi:prepilin-type N-terminal cleavage/methylation domain-containing protein
MTYHQQKGFTLIEMLAVFAIFAVLTSITIFNYTKFRSDTILTNMAYEIALSLREAQIYGVSARGVVVSGTPDYTIPYGIYAPKNSNQYYLVADEDLSGTFEGTCSSTSDQCIKTYTMQNNVSISNLQYKTNNNCTQENDGLVFLFKRPNPEPIISKNPGNGVAENMSLGIITVSAPEGSSRYIVVYNNGQISVVNNLTGICN